MKSYAKPLTRLIGELSKLPGIGGKTAQRLAFHILSLDDAEVESLATAMTTANRTMPLLIISQPPHQWTPPRR